MNSELQQYIEQEILPRYDHFDKAHQRDHVEMVIQQSLDIASKIKSYCDRLYYSEVPVTRSRSNN